MKKISKLSSCLIMCVLLPICMAAPLKANAKDAMRSPEDILESFEERDFSLPEDYVFYETLGTLSSRTASEADGSFGSSIWNNISAQDIRKTVGDIPSKRIHPLLYNLTKRVLLSTSDTGSFDNSKPDNGKDYLTLRIKALVEMGFYKDAASLYKKLDITPYNEILARYGTIALFHSDEPKLACLEVKSIAAQFSGNSFWTDTSLLCDSLLGLQDIDKDTAQTDSTLMKRVLTDKKYLYKPKSAVDILNLTQQDLIAVTQTNKIRLDKLDLKEGLGKLPNSALPILIRQSQIDRDKVLWLAIEAHRRGILSTQELSGFYAEAKDIEDKTLQTITSNYQNLKNKAIGANQKSIVISNSFLAYTIDKTALSRDALLPFAEFISESDPLQYDANIKHLVLYALLSTDHSVDKKWISSFKKNTQTSDLNKFFEVSLLLYPNAQSPEADPNHEIITYLAENMATTPTSQKNKDLYYEKLDIWKKVSNDADVQLYEKLMGLTSDLDYVMPLGSLQERLQEAVRNNSLAETILMNTIILGKVNSDSFRSSHFKRSH